MTPLRPGLLRDQHRPTSQLCLDLVGLTNLVRPGSFPLQSRRMCTAQPAWQLENRLTVDPNEAELDLQPPAHLTPLRTQVARSRSAGFCPAPPWLSRFYGSPINLGAETSEGSPNFI